MLVRSARPRIKRAADVAAESVLRRLRAALLLLAGVIIFGTSGYYLIEGMTFLDALYQTVTTISTVGFREVQPFSEVGRVFTMALILGGVGVSLYTLGLAFELLLSEQFNQWRQGRKMQHGIDRMRGHYIICGYGRIGRQVTADLREAGVPFVVIDSNPERCTMLLQQGIPFVEGDATLDDILFEAGIERARGLVGALNADADNVMAVVSARGLNARLFIVARAALPEAENKLRRAGADEVISPYLVGARRISLSMLRPAVSGFLNAVLYDQELQAEFTESVIEADSPLVGQTLAEAGLAHGRDVLPIALLRDGKLTFTPLPDTILQVADTLIVVTPVDSLRMARKRTGA
jgi:voltage-gated potassium channel